MLRLTHLSSVVLLTLIKGVVVKNCPPELNDLDVDPPVLVVEYGESVKARCLSYSNYTELSWNVTSGNLTYPTDHVVFWETESLTDWEIQPVCHMILHDVQCNKPLPLTLYKPPDHVSISAMNHTGPMVEGSEYKLRCDIHNAAPLHLLTVSWYKGFDLIKSVSFSDSAQKNPSTVSTTLYLLPSKEDDGVFYRCEATLNLEPQRSSPTVTSDPVIFTVTPQSNNCSDLMLDPPEVVVQYGEPVSVSCRSLSNYTDLRWSVPIGNVSQTENQTVTWNADNLTDWEIQPVCHKSLDEVECRKALPLIVYKMPDKVTISVTDHSGPMTAGKKYDLQCDIENFAPVHVLAVSWYKGDTLIRNRGFSELPTKTLSNKTVTFKITADKHDYDSEYRCEAKLKLGARGPQPSPVMSSNSLSVPVHYKPEITCSDWSPMMNTTLSSYPYEVSGNPSFRITWYRDQSPVSSDLRLGRNDSGLYEIVAANKMGISSCKTNITVEYAPEFHCPANYTGLEHKSFSDQCLVMASPVARIIWKKDGEVVKPLHQLLREDSGSYVITATNEHGVKQHSLTVNVWYGPEIWINVSSVVVKEGEKVSLTCRAMGLPEPEASWSFQNSTVGHQTLVIPKASLADAGEYTCTATNELGSSKETVTLTVESNCLMTIEPPKLVVEFNASATAVCSTTSTLYGMGWEAFMGAVRMKDVQSITWRVENVDYWGTEPICYIIGSGLCTLRLPVTVYKRPDNVSISTGNHTGPMVKDGRYELECAVRNVAPVNRLHVKWYKQQQLVETNSFSDENKYPADKRVTLQISPQSGDDGVQYKCEAEMELGPEGPQPPPRVTSEPLSLSVHYGPEIQQGNSSMAVQSGRDVSLNCTAMGNPAPHMTWSFQHQTKATGWRHTTLSISTTQPADAGEYTCTATNKLGSRTITVSLAVRETNIRTIIICLGLSLIVLIIISYFIYKRIERRRSGKYTVQTNGDVGMTLLDQE